MPTLDEEYSKNECNDDISGEMFGDESCKSLHVVFLKNHNIALSKTNNVSCNYRS